VPTNRHRVYPSVIYQRSRKTLTTTNHQHEYKPPSTRPVPTSLHEYSPKSTHSNRVTMKYRIYYKREGINPYWEKNCRPSLPFPR
jgi:hypothetical protein